MAPANLNYSWVANKDGLGFYRTLYQGTQLRALTSRLQLLQSPPEYVGTQGVTSVSPHAALFLVFI